MAEQIITSIRGFDETSAGSTTDGVLEIWFRSAVGTMWPSLQRLRHKNLYSLPLFTSGQSRPPSAIGPERRSPSMLLVLPLSGSAPKHQMTCNNLNLCDHGSTYPRLQWLTCKLCVDTCLMHVITIISVGGGRIYGSGRLHIANVLQLPGCVPHQEAKQQLQTSG